MGGTFIAGETNQATEKMTEIIAMWQPLREPSSLRSANAREKNTIIIRGGKNTKHHTKIICDNQNERGYVQLTADRRTKKPAHQLVVVIPLNLFPT